MLEQIGVANRILYVVFAHLLFANVNSPQNILLEVFSLSQAYQYCSLLFVNRGKKGAVVLVIDLHLHNFLYNFKLSEGQIMSKLPVEDFDFVEVDIDIHWTIYQYFIILLVVLFQQGTPQNRK